MIIWINIERVSYIYIRRRLWRIIQNRFIPTKNASCLRVLLEEARHTIVSCLKFHGTVLSQSQSIHSLHSSNWSLDLHSSDTSRIYVTVPLSHSFGTHRYPKLLSCRDRNTISRWRQCLRIAPICHVRWCERASYCIHLKLIVWILQYVSSC